MKVDVSSSTRPWGGYGLQLKKLNRGSSGLSFVYNSENDELEDVPNYFLKNLENLFC
jgi:hypothetical protein